jgi:TRAP-type mannitol/chloroaromatic compound transport system permease small subunit
MNKFTITIAVICELAAVFLVARLWIQRRMRLLPRIFVSILFLIPFVFMVYFAYFEFIGRETIFGSKKLKSTDIGVH